MTDLRHTPFRLLAVAAGLLLTGCSLLRFTVSTGEQPLPAADAALRTATRNYYRDFAASVVETADSVAASTPCYALRERAVRWKIGATGAMRQAAMQQVPEAALLEEWLLARRMEQLFMRLPDSLLFGPFSNRARSVAAGALRAVRRIASERLTPRRDSLMEAFVERLAGERPAADAALESVPVLSAWASLLAAQGDSLAYPTGTLAEVVSDLGERTASGTRQMMDQLGWGKDLVQLRLKQDSVRDRLAAQLDSMGRDFHRLTETMGAAPQLVDSVGAVFNARLSEAMDRFDRAVDHTFLLLGRERQQIERYLAERSDSLVERAALAADRTVRRTMDAVPALVGRLVLWIILLGVVMLGTPFVLGFALGRARSRRGADKARE